MKIVKILLAFSLFVLSCKTTRQVKSFTEYTDSIKIATNNQVKTYEITMLKGKYFNHPTFVIWLEDMEGNYLQTLFITRSYASGIFGRQMVNDTVWKPNSGPSYQPAALPYWTHKKGLINDKTLVPTPENPFVDAYTGATPKSDFVLKTANNNHNKVRLLVEVNQTWDWNEFWTNNKFPNNFAYKHSAQPSLIYAVTIDDTQKEFFLNPIGHGDPKGETGLLYTDISTLTTAKEIFKTIKVTIY